MFSVSLANKMSKSTTCATLRRLTQACSFFSHFRQVGETLRNLGTVLHKLGEYEDALEVLDEAIFIEIRVNGTFHGLFHTCAENRILHAEGSESIHSPKHNSASQGLDRSIPLIGSVCAGLFN